MKTKTAIVLGIVILLTFFFTFALFIRISKDMQRDLPSSPSVESTSSSFDVPEEDSSSDLPLTIINLITEILPFAGLAIFYVFAISGYVQQRRSKAAVNAEGVQAKAGQEELFEKKFWKGFWILVIILVLWFVMVIISSTICSGGLGCPWD